MGVGDILKKRFVEDTMMGWLTHWMKTIEYVRDRNLRRTDCCANCCSTYMRSASLISDESTCIHGVALEEGGNL